MTQVLTRAQLAKLANRWAEHVSKGNLEEFDIPDLSASSTPTVLKKWIVNTGRWKKGLSWHEPYKAKVSLEDLWYDVFLIISEP